MDQETIEDEITANGNRKTMLGVRCFAELKFKLTEEAKNLGISLSEHCENILLNKEALSVERDNAINEVLVVNRKILATQALLNEGKAQHKTEIQKITAENGKIRNESETIQAERDKLKREVELLIQQVAMFSDKRLLFLFDQIKGKKDVIDGADGQKYTITYNHPKDLIQAMIYSFNIKKP